MNNTSLGDQRLDYTSYAAVIKEKKANKDSKCSQLAQQTIAVSNNAPAPKTKNTTFTKKKGGNTGCCIFQLWKTRKKKRKSTVYPVEQFSPMTSVKNFNKTHDNVEPVTAQSSLSDPTKENNVTTLSSKPSSEYNSLFPKTLSHTEEDSIDHRSQSTNSISEEYSKSTTPQSSPISLLMPSIKTIHSLEDLRDKEEKSLTPRSQRIADACHITSSLSKFSRKELKEVLQSIEDQAEQWIQPGQEGAGHRKLAVQYLYTQFSTFYESVSSEEEIHIPQSIYVLAHEILKRVGNFEQISSSAGRGNFGEVSLFKIGSITLAVKTAKCVDDAEVEHEINMYCSLNPQQQQGVIPFFGITKDKELLLEAALLGSWDRKYNLDEVTQTKESPDYNALKKDIKSFLLSLQYFHNEEKNSNQKVHIDLKPANILIDKEGNSKLCDLGSVCQTIDKNGGDPATTPMFYPIDLLKFSSKYNAKSDVWQLGLAVFLMLSKKHLFLEVGIIENPNCLPMQLMYALSEKLGFIAQNSGNSEKADQQRAEYQEKIDKAIDNLSLSENAPWLEVFLKKSLRIDTEERFSETQLLEFIFNAEEVQG